MSKTMFVSSLIYELDISNMQFYNFYLILTFEQSDSDSTH